VLGRAERKMHPMECPTASVWFARFSRGVKLRMGEETRRNVALTEEGVHGLMTFLEEDWDKGNEMEREEIEELACFVLASYAGGLRGEEVPLIYLGGMTKFWGESSSHKIPHVMLTLMGRFKGEDGNRYHCVPLADVTRSGLPIRTWFQRLYVRRTGRQGRRTGWLFTKRGTNNETRAKLSQFDTKFKEYMCLVKERYPDCMPESCNPMEDMSLWRSGRRGSTVAAANNNVDKLAIEMNNNWRKQMRGRGTNPSFSMIYVYTEVRAALVARLRYSRAL
jgi:hypothetical protein